MSRIHTAPTIAVLCTFLAVALLPGAVAAQDAAPTGEGSSGAESVSEPERASYLERHHAVRRIGPVRDRTLNDIKRLKILVANFGSEVEGAQGDFEKIKETYHAAERERYRRRYVESMKIHAETREQIQKLYKKFTDKFQNQVAGLLAQCAESMVDAEFAVSSEPGQSNSGMTADIFRNAQRLQIAYQQTTLAEDMMDDDRFDEAIVHYRLAKAFAISVLVGLEQDPQKQQELEKKYQVDLLDARGFAQGNGSTEPAN